LEGELLERYEEAEEASPEKNKSAFLRSLIVDGLDAKDRDVLDAIDASDELREAVEARREEGEPLDDAARRLLREGADARERERTPKARALGAAGVALIVGTVAAAYTVGGVVGGVAMFGVWAFAFAFDDVVVEGVAGILEATPAADEIAGELEEAREERPDVEERDREGATEEEPA
jgi:hypothetical protein